MDDYVTGDSLVIDYNVNNITGSCWLKAGTLPYDQPGCTKNHRPHDGSNPEACEQLLRLLHQDTHVTALCAVIDWGWHDAILVQTDDGLKGWIDPAFVRKA